MPGSSPNSSGANGGLVNSRAVHVFARAVRPRGRSDSHLDANLPFRTVRIALDQRATTDWTEQTDEHRSIRVISVCSAPSVVSSPSSIRVSPRPFSLHLPQSCASRRRRDHRCVTRHRPPSFPMLRGPAALDLHHFFIFEPFSLQ